MQALRRTTFLSGGLLLALIGCKSNPPAQPAPAVQVATKSTVRLRYSKTSGWEVHSTASTGDIVTWKSPDSPFTVTFSQSATYDPSVNPCASAGGSTPNVYSSGTGSAPYSVPCNVTSTTSGQTYTYSVDIETVPAGAIGPIKNSATPCSGCFLEIE